MNRAIVAAVLVGWASVGWADWCPPTPNEFVTWGANDAVTSGDEWMSRLWCGSVVDGQLVTQPNAPVVFNSVVDAMGLAQNWSSKWAQLMGDVGSCNPESWSGRLMNGAYFCDYLGAHRSQTTFAQQYSPGAVLPGATTPVTYWLAEFVKYYSREHGWEPLCIAQGDAPGLADGYISAANPTNDDPLKLYFPWFWNFTAVNRASVLVHEAAHEFAPHLSDDACSAKRSCDDAYGNANAQTFTVVFNAQTVDAYRRAEGSTELEVVNYGNGVCGYVPLVPDAQRFDLVASMQLRLLNHFKFPPPKSEWPPASLTDWVGGTGLDLGDTAGGINGLAYRIDLVNGARWPCSAVCTPTDYDFATGGTRACNEQYQPGNAAINVHNRELCRSLNTEVAAGVTPKQQAALVKRLIMEAQNCLSGVSDTYVAQVCGQLSAQATRVEDIETAWPIPDQGFSFDASKAIRTCQASYCTQRRDASWDTAAAAACFDWDDPYGCLALTCGDRTALASAHGKGSYEYFESVVCRGSALGRQFAGLSEGDDQCATRYDECVIRERYLPAWVAQQAGGTCWLRATGTSPSRDPLFRTVRDAVGTVSVENFLALDRDSNLATSRCLMESVACQAEVAALEAALAKLIHDEASTRPVWKTPVLPDSWERLGGRFDRDVRNELERLGAELLNPAVSTGPLIKNARLSALVTSPEATVAIAELVGHDTYLRAGGARFAQGRFDPAALTRHAVEADPYAIPTATRATELGALNRLDQRLSSSQAQTAFSKTTRLTGAQAYTHLRALFDAKNGVELEAAFEAFVTDANAH